MAASKMNIEKAFSFLKTALLQALEKTENAMDSFFTQARRQNHRYSLLPGSLDLQGQPFQHVFSASSRRRAVERCLCFLSYTGFTAGGFLGPRLLRVSPAMLTLWAKAISKRCNALAGK